MNILFCSAGRRCELLKNFRTSMSEGSKIVAADLSPIAPALYFADRQYLVPRIDDASYIPRILEICKKEDIDAVTTLIDPEIELLAKNREKFEAIGVKVLAPYERTAKICFDKYAMYRYLSEEGIPTVQTFSGLEDFLSAYEAEKIDFPVFVKPRTGSGSVGAQKVLTLDQLEKVCKEQENLIIQEYMDCEDLDADVYIDMISHRPVSLFSKRKLETKIGGASKTISFKDEKLIQFVQDVLQKFEFCGPIDMDFFCKDGQYYLSEINPRFGGAYLHAYGAGVDFIKLIENNLRGIENQPCFGNYEEDVLMMMYDSVVIVSKDKLAE
ncbi:MAG: ATP-grasp domain-containing protein [Butyricicoccus sp.]